MRCKIRLHINAKKYKVNVSAMAWSDAHMRQADMPVMCRPPLPALPPARQTPQSDAINACPIHSPACITQP